MLSEKVKNETKTRHQELEKVMIPLLKKASGEENYLHVLGIFYKFFSAVEKQISQVMPASFSVKWNDRRKSGWIESELNELGYSPSIWDSMPGPEYLPDLHSKNYTGAMYVLEGSTLGGQHITAMLRRSLPFPDHSFRFFSGYRELTFTKWHDFLTDFNKAPEQDHADIIHAASDTFHSFRMYLELVEV